MIIVYDEWNDIEFAITRLGSNLKQIIREANQRLVEPLETEYLLLIGNNKEVDIDWDKRLVCYSVEKVLKAIQHL